MTLLISFKSTFKLHWLWGQYSWSMIMGLPTLFIAISSKCISKAVPWWEAGHVFTLTPFWVLVKVQFLTLMPTTGSSLEYFPRLPMLMPCSVPQVILWILICSLPLPIETQSSPVSMVESVILIPEERPMWFPSICVKALFWCTNCNVVESQILAP